MKFSSFIAAHAALVKDIGISSCLVGATAGLVFGVSAGAFHIDYVKIDAESRYRAYLNNNYMSENIKSAWNMNETDTIEGVPAPQDPNISFEGVGNDWDTYHPIVLNKQKPVPYWMDDKGEQDMTTEAAFNKTEDEPISSAARKYRYGIIGMVIDGAAHETLDRSFNQSLYEGIADWGNNRANTVYDQPNSGWTSPHASAISLKPTQDNTQAMVDTYKTAIKDSRILGFAGFNHAAPLNAITYHARGASGKLNGFVQSDDPTVNQQINQNCCIMLDANIPNNQTIASVQFRADQAAFLTAIATCQYFYNNLHMYHDQYQNLSVGVFGGSAFPTVSVYMGGYQRGLEFFNYAVLKQKILITGAEKVITQDREKLDDADAVAFQNLREYTRYSEELEEIIEKKDVETFNTTLAPLMYEEFSVKNIRLGDASTHYTGTFTPGDAIGITKQFLNRGASAIIAVAGPQSLDAAQEIKNQNSKCIVVGVDTAMEESDYQRYHEGCGEETKETPNFNDPFMDRTEVGEEGAAVEYSHQANSIIKFSAIKDIKGVSKKIAALAVQKKFWDISKPGSDDKEPDPKKAICTAGFQTCCNIRNGLISISWDGFVPFIQAIRLVDFINLGNPMEPLPFEEAWKEAASLYKTELLERGIEFDETYLGNKDDTREDLGLVGRVSSLLHFDKNWVDGVMYRNYHHTIGILGILLSTFSLMQFPKDMSLVPVDPDDPTSPLEIAENDQDERLIMDILTWLDRNMYFSN